MIVKVEFVSRNNTISLNFDLAGFSESHCRKFLQSIGIQSWSARFELWIEGIGTEDLSISRKDKYLDCLFVS